uniref:Coiled-coil protein 142 C-terminal domain-containing protein n=1 Tax=Amphiprion ocellaris TaxID=80972 RepID=A0AAQ5Z9H6_AMPOC
MTSGEFLKENFLPSKLNASCLPPLFTKPSSADITRVSSSRLQTDFRFITKKLDCMLYIIVTESILPLQHPPTHPAPMLPPPDQACVKGLPGEGGVLFLPSFCCLQGHYRALWMLLNQRSSLVFIHEYSRRARLAAAYVARVRHLLEHQLKNSYLTPNQVRMNWRNSSSIFELRVHLNHWSCLFSKVQSDHYLRHSLIQQTNLLLEIKQTLDLLGLQALILMEHYVYAILSAIAQTELDSVPKEVLEDILAGANLYNQAVEEQRVQHSATQLRTTLLQKAHYFTLDSGLPQIKRYHPSAFSVKEIMSILAVHHAEVAAKQLQYWAFEQNERICQVHTNHKVCTCSDNCISQVPSLSCGMSTLKSEWTWEQLQHAYQISSPHFCINHSTLQLSFCYSCNRTPLVYVPDLHLDSTFLENCHPVLANLSVMLFARLSLFCFLSVVVCRSLGSSLKDQCLANQGTNFVMPTSKQDGSVMNSLTMEHFLLLPPPLLSSLNQTLPTESDYNTLSFSFSSLSPGPLSLFPSRFTLRRQTVSLVLASVQLSTVWVMSKAYQFLSSWSLNKFLLITQGDLNVSYSFISTKCCRVIVMPLLYVTVHQTFSSLVLKTFSSDCKRMAGEIFERTMPSAVHWRPNFPSSPSEYASLAAQTVIGQVLEGVAPLSDDARVQALSITMTAFMEAWMEHILKQKIKFSIHGALQLKQDFDSIRDMIQSDRYGLSSELHQRLLGLRVFQQVDSAVVCLLQQPQAKLYLQPRAWEPFKRCCECHIGQSGKINAVTLQKWCNFFLKTGMLGAAQQEWLDLRIQSSARRWRLPGLQCVSKSEP